MAKEDKRRGATREDIRAYEDLNAELPDPINSDRIRVDEGHIDRAPHSQVPHAHVDSVHHIPITDP